MQISRFGTQAIAEHGADPSRMVVEVTETAIMRWRATGAGAARVAESGARRSACRMPHLPMQRRFGGWGAEASLGGSRALSAAIGTSPRQSPTPRRLEDERSRRLRDGRMHAAGRMHARRRPRGWLAERTGLERQQAVRDLPSFRRRVLERAEPASAKRRVLLLILRPSGSPSAADSPAAEIVQLRSLIAQDFGRLHRGRWSSLTGRERQGQANSTPPSIITDWPVM